MQFIAEKYVNPVGYKPVDSAADLKEATLLLLLFGHKKGAMVWMIFKLALIK